MIDLHMHSTFSDGSLTPEALAAECSEAGLTAAALTDHDTVDGVGRFAVACEAVGITAISGVEISADVGKGGMHMLGYCLDPQSPSLSDLLVKIRNGRQLRNVHILENLNAAGLDLSMDEVMSFSAKDGVLGRPHFAQAMIARGFVKSKEEAFNRYLAKGQPAYAERFRLSPEDSIAAVRQAGGLSVLAHPFTLALNKSELDAFVAELAGYGLEGIEVFYSEHRPDMVRDYIEMAEKYGLLLTGGSDFHGEVNQAISIGVGFGNLRVNDDLAEKLLARKRERG